MSLMDELMEHLSHVPKAEFDKAAGMRDNFLIAFEEFAKDIDPAVFVATLYTFVSKRLDDSDDKIKLQICMTHTLIMEKVAQVAKIKVGELEGAENV